jgi:hypothetical protein
MYWNVFQFKKHTFNGSIVVSNITEFRLQITDDNILNGQQEYVVDVLLSTMWARMAKSVK